MFPPFLLLFPPEGVQYHNKFVEKEILFATVDIVSSAVWQKHFLIIEVKVFGNSASTIPVLFRSLALELKQENERDLQNGSDAENHGGGISVVDNTIKQQNYGKR